jgi:hypothetical protein
MSRVWRQRQRERRPHSSAYVSIRQDASGYVRIRQDTPAYANIREHTAERYTCSTSASAAYATSACSRMRSMRQRMHLEHAAAYVLPTRRPRAAPAPNVLRMQYLMYY